MSFTVKVVFIGLIGFVPGPEGQKDMTALLINPESEQLKETECPAPPHLSMVVLLHGKCEKASSDCYRTPDHLKKQAKALGLGRILENQEIGLIWLLDQEALDLSGDDEKLKLKNPWRFPWAAPRSVRQSTDFDWVPSMKKLSSGQGQINEDCRKANQDCPLHATFRFQGGTTGACHVFHDNDRNVRIFEYLIPGQRLVRRRAVADAVQLEYDEKGKYVTLLSESLEGRGHTRKAKAFLSPGEGDDTLTLVVANISSPPGEEEGHSRPHGCHHAHSDVFFQLLEDRNVPRPVRVLSEKTRKVDSGPCEQEVGDFAGLFSDSSLFIRRHSKDQFPHSGTACDGVTFPKPTQ